MQNSSPSGLKLRVNVAPPLLFAAALVLLGAGCDLGSKVTLRWPFALSEPQPSDSAAAALALKTEVGTTMTIRPSFLGVTGTVADIVGSEEGLKTAAVKAFEHGKRVEIEWSEKGDPERRGTVAAAAHEDSHEMFLPGFWKAENQAAIGASLVWMSPAAWRELNETGSTEWKLGLGGEATAEAALKTLKAFNDMVTKLSGGLTGSATSVQPFRILASKQVLTFPLRVDGKIENVRALKAASWFADYIVLENPENPLILKVSVNPVAVGALNALKPLGVDISALGYEITSVSRP